MTTDTTTAMRMALDDIEVAIKHFTRIPSTLKDSEARGKSHAAIAALREAIERDGWQPISMAPKDGTVVDLWASNQDGSDGDRIVYCWFEDGAWREFDDRNGGLEVEVSLTRGYAITHWRKLPGAPKD